MDKDFLACLLACLLEVIRLYQVNQSPRMEWMNKTSRWSVFFSFLSRFGFRLRWIRDLIYMSICIPNAMRIVLHLIRLALSKLSSLSLH